MLSADTNLFLYAANPHSPHHAVARAFFSNCSDEGTSFTTCDLVLVEIYMQLRNPAVLRKPLSSADAAAFCARLREHPRWQHVDYNPDVAPELWRWAQASTSGYRHIIDARLALTLIHHGVTRFATANVKDFQEFNFEKVWNPLLETE